MSTDADAPAPGRPRATAPSAAKTALGGLAALAIFALLAFVFGYFDAELGDERRSTGLGLIITGMSIAWPAMRRLAEDWPRLKPQHNVDLAFAQIGFAGVILLVACLLGGRFGATFTPLVEPTPKLTQPVSYQGVSPSPPAETQGASRPAGR